MPPELHLQILEELLQSESGHIKRAECHGARLPNSDLLFVSKDIHDKARAALRNVNILTVDYHTRTSPELLTVDHKAIKYFRHIVLNVKLHRWAVRDAASGAWPVEPTAILFDISDLLADARTEKLAQAPNTTIGKVYLRVNFVPDFVILSRMLVHPHLDYFDSNQTFMLYKWRNSNPMVAAYGADFVQYVMGWLQAQLKHIIVRQKSKWGHGSALEHVTLTSNVESDTAGLQFLRKDDATVAFRDNRRGRMGLIKCNDLDGVLPSDIMIIEHTFAAEVSIETI